MFPNWSGWKTVKLFLVSLTGLAPVATPPAYVALVTSILSGVTGVVIVLSGSPLGPAMARKS